MGVYANATKRREGPVERICLRRPWHHRTARTKRAWRYDLGGRHSRVRQRKLGDLFAACRLGFRLLALFSKRRLRQRERQRHQYKDSDHRTHLDTRIHNHHGEHILAESSGQNKTAPEGGRRGSLLLLLGGKNRLTR